MVTGEKTDWGMWYVPLCTVFPVMHGSRFGHMKSRILPGSWINLGPHPSTKAWRILNVLTRQERVHYHLWFLEDMTHRRDALTNFDRNYLRAIERPSPSGTITNLSQEARVALQLRELYKNPETQPERTVILEGHKLLEYKATKEGTAPETASESKVVEEGVDPYEEYQDIEEKEQKQYFKQPVNPKEGATDQGAAADEAHDRNADESTPNVENQSGREVTGEPNEPSTTPSASQDNATTTTSTSDNGSQPYRELFDDEDQDDFNAFELDEDQDDQHEMEMAKDDEEYEDLIKVKNLRKDGEPLTDGELRNKVKENEMTPVGQTPTEEDEEGMTIDQFATEYGLDLSEPTESSAQIGLKRTRRTSKIVKKASKGELLELQKTMNERRAHAKANKSMGDSKLTSDEKAVLRYVYENNLGIKWLVTENPKSRGSKAKFEKYGWKDLRTAKENDMSFADCVNDFEKGYFEIDPQSLDLLLWTSHPNTALARGARLLTTDLVEDLDKPTVPSSASASVHLASSVDSLPGNEQGPGIVNVLLDRQQLPIGSRVVLLGMEKSKYRNENLNESTGEVRSYNVTSRRYLVLLDEVTDNQKMLWCRGLNLETIDESGLKAKVHDEPQPKLVEILKKKEQNMKQKQLLEISSKVQGVIRLLEGDLAEAETLSTLKLYEMMGEGYRLAMAKAFDISTHPLPSKTQHGVTSATHGSSRYSRRSPR